MTRNPEHRTCRGNGFRESIGAVLDRTRPVIIAEMAAWLSSRIRVDFRGYRTDLKQGSFRLFRLYGAEPAEI